MRNRAFLRGHFLLARLLVSFTLGGLRIRETLSYQREVDKGKLTAVESFEKLTFRAEPFVGAVHPVCSDQGLTLETSAFQNSLRRLIYRYQFHVDN